MASTFGKRIEELQERVGDGNLVMRCNVHQPYAAAQHNRQWYKHPHGGMPDYLQTPFETEHEDMLHILAESALENIQAGAVDAVQKFDEWVQTYAPVEFDVLRESVNLYVEDNNGILYQKTQRAPYDYSKE